MEVIKEEQLLKEFEDIMININEYCEAVVEKIRLIEEIVVDLTVDLGKVREISIHFYRTIEKLKENFSKEDPKKVPIELSELSYRPQTSQGNASNPLSEEEKEKYELKAKPLAQRPIVHNTGIRTINIYYKNTSNLRWKYRRKKFVFPTKKWISDGNCDGKCVVGNQLVAKKISTVCDGKPSDSLPVSAQSGRDFRRDFRRKFPSENPLEISAVFVKKI